jgi:Asp/Glu/hydantoin racemase
LIEAAAEGRRFAVVTTTPALVGSIERAVGRLGLLGAFAGVALTRGDAAAVMSDENRLFRELHAAISALVNAGGVEAIVIGGGPLAEAGRRLAATWPLAIVEPVPTAVRRLARLLTLHDPEPQR